jgi:hypothetical protein
MRTCEFCQHPGWFSYDGLPFCAWHWFHFKMGFVMSGRMDEVYR